MSVVWNVDPAIGCDIRLDAGADLAVTPGGDLDLIGNVRPQDNVWQATILRLITTLGTYLFENGYGTNLRQFVDQPMTPNLKRIIEAQINATVLSDPRVQEVTNLQVTQNTNLGYLVQLSFRTVSGETVSGTTGLDWLYHGGKVDSHAMELTGSPNPQPAGVVLLVSPGDLIQGALNGDPSRLPGNTASQRQLLFAPPAEGGIPGLNYWGTLTEDDLPESVRPRSAWQPFLVLTDHGTANAYAVTSDLQTYSHGISFLLCIGAGHTNLDGASTVALGSLAAKSLVLPDGSNPPAGALVEHRQYLVSYDGTRFVVMAGLVGGAPAQPLTVLSTTPAESATGVPLDSAIVFYMSANVDPSTVSVPYSVSFNVLASTPVNLPGTVTVEGSTITLTPDSPLEPDTNYAVLLQTSIADTHGNHLSETLLLNFQTSS